MPALQGFIVEWPLATPTMGLTKSVSPKPTARSMARLGLRATPAVMVLDLRFSGSDMASVLWRPGRGRNSTTCQTRQAGR